MYLSLQFEGDRHVVIQPVANESDNVVNVWAYEIEAEVGRQKKKGWKNEDISIILSVNSQYSAKCLFLLYLELKSRRIESEILFESQTLSQEWPVVIACCEFFNLALQFV